MSEVITLSHGSGGKMTHRLINELFHKAFNNEILMEKGDSAILENAQGKLAFTTDSYVITPISFPGGDIGKLAICGTVNDLTVAGAKPMYLSCGFIIEEGFEISELEKIVQSMASACKEAGVKIVTGDTKVVTRGAADRLFINTTGIGIIPTGVEFTPKKISANDKVIVTGTIGDHEATILVTRENFHVNSQLQSDCAPLFGMIEPIVQEFSLGIRVMRDATRGGLASTLNEFVENSSYSIKLVEETIPLKTEVSGLTEMLGLDPLYMANEGKIVMVVADNIAEQVLNMLKTSKYGVDAAIIGEVIEDGKGRVYMKTSTGGSRVVDMLAGEQLPRIC